MAEVYIKNKPLAQKWRKAEVISCLLLKKNACMLTSVQLHFRTEHGVRMVFVWAKKPQFITVYIWNLLQVVEYPAKAYEDTVETVIAIYSCDNFVFTFILYFYLSFIY